MVQQINTVLAGLHPGCLVQDGVAVQCCGVQNMREGRGGGDIQRRSM